MATALAEKAKKSYANHHYQLAVDLYTQAITIDPQNAQFFTDRAEAYLKLNKFTEAKADANKAIELDSSIVNAYSHKASACLKLGEYLAAKDAIVAAHNLIQNKSKFNSKECDNHIAEETVNRNESTKPNPSHSDVPTSNGSKASNITTVNLGDSEKPNSDSNLKKEMELAHPNYRHAFYQKPEEVVVTVFAKGVPAKSIVIEFGEQILNVTIDIPGQLPYHFQPRLFGKIVPDKCRYEVLSTKVEIHLAKAEAINWASLEYNHEVAASSAVGSGRPAYPSSKPRVADWDKLEAQVKEEEKEEKLGGAAGVEKKFGEMYKNADEDTRRAMTKSFLESNGTVFSTNWKEVGAKKVEGIPP